MRTPRRLTGFARKMRHEPTDAERKLWFLLRDRRFEGVKFRRQYALLGYILDFYCVALRLCIELDGGQHFDDGGPAEKYDKHRQKVLEQAGVTVIRFENAYFLKNMPSAAQMIFETLQRLALGGPHPAPLPEYREREKELPAHRKLGPHAGGD